jgi:hypothetical protein
MLPESFTRVMGFGKNRNYVNCNTDICVRLAKSVVDLPSENDYYLSVER